MTPLAAVLAVVVGVALGLLGGGGAILTVPILVYVLGLTAKVAVPVSLVVVGLASAIGAVGHWRAGRLVPGEGMRFAGFAMLGAVVGARVGLLLPERLQLGLFAVIVLVAAVAMWRSVGAAAPTGPAHPGWQVNLVGSGVGALTGLVGVGGGFLFVPALVSMLRYPVSKATATSLLVIALNAGAALASLGPSVALPWRIVLPFLGCVLGGLFLGQRLSPRVGADTLKRSFALLLVAVGAFVLVQNLR